MGVFPSRELSSNIQKIKNPPNYPTQELWGPIPKEYSYSLGIKTWIPPGYVDGIPILTKCSEIPTYLKTVTGASLFMVRKHPPACWEDDANALVFLASQALPDDYYVSVGDRRFYEQQITGVSEIPAGVSSSTQQGQFANLLGFKGLVFKKGGYTRKRTNRRRNHRKRRKSS
jgi:hypothetical protein